MNYRQWGLLKEVDKEPSGIIVQRIDRITPALYNWLVAKDRQDITVRLGFIVSNEDVRQILSLNLPKAILGSSLDDIRQKAETDNIVYLADPDEIEALKGQDLKLIEKGNAGLFIELSLAVMLLGNTTYRDFLLKLAGQGFIKNDEVDVLLKETEKLGFIRLPKIQKVLDMWNELDKGFSLTDIWA